MVDTTNSGQLLRQVIDGTSGEGDEVGVEILE